MPEIEVLSTGLYATLQDEGRPGFQSQGVPLGGAMDRKSAALANQLVGNALDTPVVESTLLGPKLRFHGPAQIALAGASIRPKLNGRAIPTYRTVAVQTGSVLDIRGMHKGCRTYLAIRGDWVIRRWLGSCSPPPYQSDLLTPESRLKPGQRLQIKAFAPIEPRRIPPQERPNFPKIYDIRVFPGPEWGAFASAATAHFLSQAFTLSKDTNRMGLRLREALPAAERLPTLLSSAVLPGTVQAPPSGQPIILMADAQTTGGYPRLAQVCTNDLPALAPWSHGDRIRLSLDP